MEQGETKKETYARIKNQHATLDRRLNMLLKKPYLTSDEEMEIKVLKKQKLYYKDMMEQIKRESGKGDRD